MKNKKLIISLTVIAAVLTLLILRPTTPAQIELGFYDIMGTVGKIVVVADTPQNARRAAETAIQKLQMVEKLMSTYDPNSQISQINSAAAIAPIPVSKETFEILKLSKKYSRLSSGAFDITVGPLIDLWQRCADANQLPSEDQIKKVKANIGSEKLILNEQNQSAHFAAAEMKIDLGAIAKGYAIDLAVQTIQNTNGITAGLVDVGGDIRCFGKPAKNKTWIIGIQNPRTETIIAKINLENAAVATSGDYRRFKTIKGKRYSHIINPKSAQSAENIISATVIAPTAAQADALATAASIMDTKKTIALIETIENTEAILITAAGNIIKTKSVKHTLKP